MHVGRVPLQDRNERARWNERVQGRSTLARACVRQRTPRRLAGLDVECPNAQKSIAAQGASMQEKARKGKEAGGSRADSRQIQDTVGRSSRKNLELAPGLNDERAARRHRIYLSVPLADTRSPPDASHHLGFDAWIGPHVATNSGPVSIDPTPHSIRAAAFASPWGGKNPPPGGPKTRTAPRILARSRGCCCKFSPLPLFMKPTVSNPVPPGRPSQGPRGQGGAGGRPNRGPGVSEGLRTALGMGRKGKGRRGERDRSRCASRLGPPAATCTCTRACENFWGCSSRRPQERACNFLCGVCLFCGPLFRGCPHHFLSPHAPPTPPGALI